jgi:uncharacterized protein (AIM24 family)
MASGYSIERFLRTTAENAAQGECFEQESERMLRIDVDGGIWLKPGAAIAYRGDIAFERRPTLDAQSLLDGAFRELTPLVRAVGRGRLYCGRHGSHVRIVRLEGEAMVINFDELLAFEESLAFEPRVVGHGIGLAAGGMLTMRLTGHGAVAFVTHGEPLSLRVSRTDPVSTDPSATIAWSGNLTPQLKTDLTWRSLFRHGGQEPVQMLFEGDGYVIVQPYEDPRRLTLDAASIEKLTAMFTV